MSLYFTAKFSTMLKAHDVRYMMDILLQEVKAEFMSRYSRYQQSDSGNKVEGFLLLHEQELKQRVGRVIRDILFTIAMDEVDDREAVIECTREAFGCVNERLRLRLQTALCRN